MNKTKFCSDAVADSVGYQTTQCTSGRKITKQKQQKRQTNKQKFSMTAKSFDILQSGLTAPTPWYLVSPPESQPHHLVHRGRPCHTQGLRCQWFHHTATQGNTGDWKTYVTHEVCILSILSNGCVAKVGNNPNKKIQPEACRRDFTG